MRGDHERQHHLRKAEEGVATRAVTRGMTRGMTRASRNEPLAFDQDKFFSQSYEPLDNNMMNYGQRSMALNAYHGPGGINDPDF